MVHYIESYTVLDSGSQIPNSGAAVPGWTAMLYVSPSKVSSKLCYLVDIKDMTCQCCISSENALGLTIKNEISVLCYIVNLYNGRDSERCFRNHFRRRRDWWWGAGRIYDDVRLSLAVVGLCLPSALLA